MPFGEATRSDSDSDLAEAEITQVASTPRPPCHQIWLMLIIPSLNPSTDQSSEMATHKLPHKCAAATHHPDRQSSCTASRRQYTSVNTCMYDRIMCGSGDDLTRRQAPRPKDGSRSHRWVGSAVHPACDECGHGYSRRGRKPTRRVRGVTPRTAGETVNMKAQVKNTAVDSAHRVEHVTHRCGLERRGPAERGHTLCPRSGKLLGDQPPHLLDQVYRHGWPIQLGEVAEDVFVFVFLMRLYRESGGRGTIGLQECPSAPNQPRHALWGI